MGILAGRKKRADKLQQESKESGAVSSMPFILQKQIQDNTKRKELKRKQSGTMDILKFTGNNGHSRKHNNKKFKK